VLNAQGYKSPPKNPRLPAGGFVKIQAFAKINLYLEVLGKRADGYHDIFSVMQSVDLCDDLIISVDFDAFDKTAQARLICGVSGIPADEKNLVIKAANVLIREYGLKQNLKFELTKRIPMGAGLAGGSSDCAATLLGINKLLNLNIPFEKLIEIGKSLGADVPFCLTSGTAVTEGIGEKIKPLPPHPPCFILIACPEIHVSTAKIFSRFDIKNIKQQNCERRENFINIFEKKDLSQIALSLYNIFTPITAGLHPEISDLILKFRNIGALGAEMSGTGSSVFAFFDNEKTAQKAFNIIKKSVTKVFLCKPINRGD